jgi:hypothetical protein
MTRPLAAWQRVPGRKRPSAIPATYVVFFSMGFLSEVVTLVVWS